MEDDPRVPSSRRVTRTGSSVSRSSRMSTRSGGTIGQLLDDTTLGEFLSAVENVRKRTELDGSTQSLAHPRPSQTFSKRKTSFAGYTSAAFAATKRFTTSKVTTDKNDLKKKEEVALVD